MTLQKTLTTIALAAIATISLAGCGGSASGGPVPLSKSHYTEVQILGAVGNITGDCHVAVFLTDSAEVALYANAGDPVASNPTRTAGVKFEPTDGKTTVPQCYRLFTRGLSTLK